MSNAYGETYLKAKRNGLLMTGSFNAAGPLVGFLHDLNLAESLKHPLSGTLTLTNAQKTGNAALYRHGQAVTVSDGFSFAGASGINGAASVNGAYLPAGTFSGNAFYTNAGAAASANAVSYSGVAWQVFGTGAGVSLYTATGAGASGATPFAAAGWSGIANVSGALVLTNPITQTMGFDLSWS